MLLKILWIVNFFVFLKEAEVKPVVNRNYLPALLELIDSSEKEILGIMFSAREYPEYTENIGKEIQDALIRAKRRGVKIQLILDASSWNKSNAIKNRDFADTLIKEGIEIYYDPLDVTTHTKLLIVDKKIVLLGSNNWSFYSLKANNEASIIIISEDIAEYFKRYFEKVKRYSTDVFPFVYRKKKVFLQKKESSQPPFIYFPQEKRCVKAKVMPLPNRNYVDVLHELIKNAKKEIVVAILSARYYPDYRFDANSLLLEDLISASKRGVKVRILLDASNYSKANDWDNKKYGRLLKKLSNNKIEVFYDRPDIATHCKLMVVDSSKVLIGSTNWSFHALELNNETAVLVDSKPVALYFLSYIKKISEGAKEQEKVVEKWFY